MADAEAPRGFSLTVAPESKARADEVFAALSKGGEITMPMTDTAWRSYSGSLVDRFGIQWSVHFEYADHAELAGASPA